MHKFALGVAYGWVCSIRIGSACGDLQLNPNRARAVFKTGQYFITYTCGRSDRFDPFWPHIGPTVPNPLKKNGKSYKMSFYSLPPSYKKHLSLALIFILFIHQLLQIVEPLHLSCFLSHQNNMIWPPLTLVHPKIVRPFSLSFSYFVITRRRRRRAWGFFFMFQWDFSPLPIFIHFQ